MYLLTYKLAKKYDMIGNLTGKPASSGYIYSSDITGNSTVHTVENPISKQTILELFKSI